MYLCPACQSEFDTLPAVCPNCDLSLRVLNLRPILTPAGDDLVLIAEFDGLLGAQIVEGRLRGEGIQALIAGASQEAYMGDADPGSADPIRLLVHRSQAEQVIRLLGADAEWSEDDLARYMSMLDEPQDQ